MWQTSARLLRLLGLLQARRDWPGPELAERLGVTPRTVRRDIDRLRGLGYPVHATPGTTGGYRLGAGTALPPLLFDDEEAVAVAVALGTAAGSGVAGMQGALAKLDQVLPAGLRQRVAAVQATVVPLTGPGPTVDPAVLTLLAAACRDHERLRFGYRDRDGAETVRDVEPHRLVYSGRRWYLMAFDTERAQWRTFRVDRMDPHPPAGPRFVPRTPPEDAATYTSRGISTGTYRYRARFLMHAPAERVAEHFSPRAALVEAVDERTCLLHAGSDSLDALALHTALVGVDFEVLDPPELVEHVRAAAARLTRAAGRAGGAVTGS